MEITMRGMSEFLDSNTAPGEWPENEKNWSEMRKDVFFENSVRISFGHKYNAAEINRLLDEYTQFLKFLDDNKIRYLVSYLPAAALYYIDETGAVQSVPHSVKSEALSTVKQYIEVSDEPKKNGVVLYGLIVPRDRTKPTEIKWVCSDVKFILPEDISEISLTP
jgi:hypothetical protein